jgi:DNA polymerase-3 subunit gamma/tau
MLGIADAGRLYDLFETIMAGDARAALDELRAQHADGADPQTLLRDLASLVHDVSMARVAPGVEDPTVPPAERARRADLAGRLSMRSLSRAWQMLLKMLEEAERAPSAMMAAEMAVIRLAHVAELPAPADLVRGLTGQGAAPAPAAEGARGAATTADGQATAPARPGPAALRTSPASPSSSSSSQARGGGGRVEARASRTAAATATVPDPVPVASPEPEPAPVEEGLTLEALEARLSEARELLLANQFAHYVKPLRLRPGVLEIALAEGAPRDLPGDLGRALSAIGPGRWSVVVEDGPGGATLAERRRAAAEALEARAGEHPFVAAALAAFPGARIAAVRPLAGPAARAAPGPAPEEAADPGPPLDDDDMDPFEED